MAKKILLGIALVTLFACFFLFDLGQYFNLAYIKASQTRFAQLYAERTLPVLAAFMAVYVLGSALALPAVAPLLSLLGGALFGFFSALVMVSFASTIGATLAAGAARYLLRSFTARTFAAVSARINRNVEREGAFYLFTLRLIPLFPFSAINLAMGLTSMRLVTFYWVSQLGMLPGTAVYINAGRELGRIESLSGILSPGLVASFALLGLFPLLSKKIIDVARKKRGAKPFSE